MISTIITICDHIPVIERRPKNFQMEFRIFLPYCVSSDAEWADIASLAKYEATLERLLDSCGNAFPEQREDMYLVGGERYGIKYRAGKKLEIKIRLDVYENNIEHFRKVKIGKKGQVESMLHHKDEILTLLQADGVLFPTDDALITAQKLVGVQKARNVVPAGDNVQRETCMITTNAHDRKWFSISVEGPKDDLKRLLRSPDLGRGLPSSLIWETLHGALSLARQHGLSVAAERTFQPVVGGYPTWIRVAAVATRGEMEVKGVAGNVDSFLSSIMYEPVTTAR